MIKSIPLSKLIASPRNVRRHSEPQADAELKASIAARGLLQNLIVRPAAKGTRFALIGDQFASVSKISNGYPYNDFAVTHAAVDPPVDDARNRGKPEAPRLHAKVRLMPV